MFSLHMLRGAHYAHLMHMQITCTVYMLLFGDRKFLTQYDRLSQRQLCASCFSCAAPDSLTPRDDDCCVQTCTKRHVGYVLY